MKVRTVLKTLTAAALAGAVFVSAFFSAEAGRKNISDGVTKVYTASNAHGITHINMTTPENTVKLYCGMTWERLEYDMGVKLEITDSACGAEAQAALANAAAAVGASVDSTMDMHLQIYGNNGYHERVFQTNAPIRLTMGLLPGADKSKDYAIISLKNDGTAEVLGDIDVNPETLTVDTMNFNVYAVASAPAGTFNAYRAGFEAAAADIQLTDYVRGIGGSAVSTIDSEKIPAIGIISDGAAVARAIGGPAMIKVTDCVPGPDGLAAFQAAAAPYGARGADYFVVELKKGFYDVKTKTNEPLRLVMSVPYDFPAYADYYVEVVDENGAITVLKDIDATDGTITVDTDCFRGIGVFWTNKQ